MIKNLLYALAILPYLLLAAGAQDPEPQAEPEIVSSGGRLTVLTVKNRPPGSTVFWVLPDVVDDDNYRKITDDNVYLAIPEPNVETTYTFVAVISTVTDSKIVSTGIKFTYTTGPPAPPGPGPQPPQPTIPKGSQIVVIYESETKTLEQSKMLAEIRKLGFPVLEVDPDQPVTNTNRKVVTEYHYDLVVNGAGLKYPAVIVTNPSTGEVLRVLAFDKDTLKGLK